MPMTFRCVCGQALRVRDDDLGKRVRCPSCRTGLPIPRPAARQQPVTNFYLTLESEHQVGVPAVPNAPAPPADPLYYLLLRRGPFPLSRLAEQGVSGDCLVWKQGMAGWVKAPD